MKNSIIKEDCQLDNVSKKKHMWLGNCPDVLGKDGKHCDLENSRLDNSSSFNSLARFGFNDLSVFEF